MLLIPHEEVTRGLIRELALSGVTRSSSVNERSERKENPINYTTGDRWCSGGVNEYDPEWWMVTFDYWIYPTNYSFSNNQNDCYPHGWTLQGKKQNKWINLSTVTSSPIIEGQSHLFNIDIDDGPFQTFRFYSTHNGYSSGTKLYHFCIYKIDLFGLAFKDPCYYPPKQKYNKNYFPFIFLFTFSK